MRECEKNYRDMIVIARRWRWMPTLDWYVLREFLLKLGVLLFVFATLFILGDVLNELEDFLSKEASMRDFFTFLMLKLPGNMRFVMPLSLLLGCIWTMANFGKNSEIVAMRSSGISLYRCAASILLIGFGATVTNIYFNEALVPFTEREAQVLYHNALDKTQEISQKLCYRTPDSRRSWFFFSFTSGEENSGVLLKQFRPDGTLAWDISASGAFYDRKTGWHLRNAHLTPYSDDGLMSLPSKAHPDFLIPLSEAPETPEDIFNAVKDEDELPVWTIWSLVSRNIHMPDQIRAKYMSVFYYRLAYPWACLLAIFLGIPIATKNERSGSLLAIISAVVVIVIYLALAQVFLLGGKLGYLPPVIAGTLPTLGFIGYGLHRIFKEKL